MAELGTSDVASLGPDAVAAAIEQLTRLEHEVSQSRHRVQQMMDVLTAPDLTDLALQGVGG